jgi:signal transduction histidine kinase
MADNVNFAYLASRNLQRRTACANLYFVDMDASYDLQSLLEDHRRFSRLSAMSIVAFKLLANLAKQDPSAERIVEKQYPETKWRSGSFPQVARSALRLSMKLKLSTKALFWLITVIIIAMALSVTALIYAWQTRYTLDDSILKDSREMLDAAELDISLLKQRNYITFHILTGDDPKWMEKIDNLEPISSDFLLNFQESPDRPQEKKLHISLEEMLRRYGDLRNKVLTLYKSGDHARARDLAFTDLAILIDACIAECDELVKLKKHDILEVLQWSEREAKIFTMMVVASIFLIISLGSGLVWMLVKNIFLPLRKIAREVQNFPIKSANGATPKSRHQDDLETLVSGLRIFMAEVTETRSDLEESRHQLVQSARLAALGNTVAQVAHEIKNRLIVLGGFARLIEKKAGDAEMARKNAAIIYQEVNKLEHMLKEITEFSKPMQLATVVCSLNTLLDGVMIKLNDVAPPNIELQMSQATDIPPVRIDSERMEQVIINLIKNAMEVLGSHGNIFVSTCRHKRGAALTIKDEGPGMTEEVRGRIFEPFYTTKSDGTGLGLAISRKIILDHGGEIICESAPDKGTKFTITLPPA